MPRSCVLLVLLCSASVYASAQSPSAATLDLSLKTVSKALQGCRESYTRTPAGTKEPFVSAIMGAGNYGRDIQSLDHAQRFTDALIATPDKVNGRLLVSILSTTDDFSIGVGSTRAELLRHMVIDKDVDGHMTQLGVTAEAMNDCQISLYNAGDDFVTLVLAYVGAEDDASKPKKR